jgi:excisionase family DNA binding protein
VNGITLQIDQAQLEPLIRRVIAETVAQLEGSKVKLSEDRRYNEATNHIVLLLKPREAAKALSISERTLWELTDHGKIPHVRIGRAVRYDPRDLQAWIDAQKDRPPLTPT